MDNRGKLDVQLLFDLGPIALVSETIAGDHVDIGTLAVDDLALQERERAFGAPHHQHRVLRDRGEQVRGVLLREVVLSSADLAVMRPDRRSDQDETEHEREQVPKDWPPAGGEELLHTVHQPVDAQPDGDDDPHQRARAGSHRARALRRPR